MNQIKLCYIYLYFLINIYIFTLIDYFYVSKIFISFYTFELLALARYYIYNPLEEFILVKKLSDLIYINYFLFCCSINKIIADSNVEFPVHKEVDKG